MREDRENHTERMLNLIQGTHTHTRMHIHTRTRAHTQQPGLGSEVFVKFSTPHRVRYPFCHILTRAGTRISGSHRRVRLESKPRSPLYTQGKLRPRKFLLTSHFLPA